jgi:hypothetical protein
MIHIIGSRFGCVNLLDPEWNFVGELWYMVIIIMSDHGCVNNFADGNWK